MISNSTGISSTTGIGSESSAVDLSRTSYLFRQNDTISRLPYMGYTQNVCGSSQGILDEDDGLFMAFRGVCDRM